MANKKVNQLTSKPAVNLTDLFLIADPTSGQAYKTTISDLGTAIGSGVSSVNTLVGAVVLDTDDIQELVSPTNKWFTDTRARAAISGGTGISYNSGTGVITNAVTSGQIATALGYTPADGANYLPLAGGTMGGAIFGTIATFASSTSVTALGITLSGASGDGVKINHSAGRAFNIQSSGGGFGILINNETASTSAPFTIQKQGLAVITLTDAGAGSFASSLTANSFIKSSGTSAQFLKADGSIDSTGYQPLLTNPVTGTGTSGIVAVFNGTSSITDSSIYANSTRVSIGADVTTTNKFTAVASTSSSYAVVAQASSAANGIWSNVLGSGEIFRGQTAGGSYFIINNGGNAFLNGNLNVGDFASTSYKLNVVGTANITGALSGTSATFSTGFLVNGTTDVYPEFITNSSDGDVLLGFSNTGDSNNGWGIGRRNTGEFWIANYTGNFRSGTRTTPFTINTSNYIDISGLRLKGSDSSNTIYVGNQNMAITAESGYNISIGRSSDVTKALNVSSTSGYVGIGKTGAGFALDITSGTDGTVANFNSNRNGGGGFGISNNGNARIYLGNANWMGIPGESTSSTAIALASAENSPIIFGRNAATSVVETMRITSTGGVGIGTTSASAHKLRVIDAGVAQGATLFATDNNIYNSIQVYTAGADGYNAGATVMIMGKNTSTNRSLNAGGTINASGADYAEYMTKAIEDNINKGDIVGVNEIGLLTNKFAEAKSFVIKSTDPSYVGGDTWASVDKIGKLSDNPTEEEKAAQQAKIEIERAKVDRIAFSGQVPCNVLNAKVGDYIIPINDNGKIKGQAVTNPTFEQYQISVGKVWKIMEDGRAWVAVKIG